MLGGGCCLGSFLLQFSVWLSTAVCFVLLLVSAFPKTSWFFQLKTPKCLTLNLWLWSPYQPPPSFACWGLPLAMPACGGDHVYLEIACTLAGNCHINCIHDNCMVSGRVHADRFPCFPHWPGCPGPLWVPTRLLGSLPPAMSIWRWCFLSCVSG